MKKKLLFIYNPKAGKAQIKNKLSEILDLFTTAGYEVTAVLDENIIIKGSYITGKFPALHRNPRRLHHAFRQAKASSEIIGANITGKNVRLDDGVFEVTLIKRPKTPAELNNIIASLLNRHILNFLSCLIRHIRKKAECRYIDENIIIKAVLASSNPPASDHESFRQNS